MLQARIGLVIAAMIVDMNVIHIGEVAMEVDQPCSCPASRPPTCWLSRFIPSMSSFSQLVYHNIIKRSNNSHTLYDGRQP
mmetsp:Transcript_26007/g.42649  ORF Transcript_26007/g.42649 Transcript_26007/m.42649 type:complete len:80 (-) Transcript_26007:501-740(-)